MNTQIGLDNNVTESAQNKVSKEFLLDSLLTDPNISIKSELFSGVVKDLFEQIYSNTPRCRNKEIKFRTIDFIISNVLLAHFKNISCVALSRNRNDYIGTKRLGELGFNHTDMVKALDYLIKNEWINQKRGAESPELSTRIWANPKLINKHNELSQLSGSIWKIKEIDDLIVVRNSKGRDLKYRKTKYSNIEERRLSEYNKLILNTQIDLKCNQDYSNIRLLEERSKEEIQDRINIELFNIPPSITYTVRDYLQNKHNKTDSLDALICCIKALPIPHKNQLKRIYNLKQKDKSRYWYCGRFYGAPYQGLPGEIRASITINGNPTVEIDYCTYHIAMAYHMEGLQVPQTPYRYDKGSPLRDIAKLIILVAINATTRDSAISAVMEDVNRDTNLKNALRESHFKGKNIKEKLTTFYDEFLAYHKPIRSYFSSGKGIAFQRKDSDIASDILWHFTEKKIPILSIHDSFIIEKQYESELEQVMKENYRRKFNNFDIEVDVK